MEACVKTKKLIIVGAGEFAKIAYEYFSYDSPFEVIGVCVERRFLNGEKFYGMTVEPLEDITSIFPPDDYFAFVALPALDLNQSRARLYRELKEKGYRLASYVSSSAFVWRNVTLGENTFIFENNTIQPFVEVGDNVIVWSGNHVGHSSKIEDHVFISSHVVISGFCSIGSGSFLGVNSTFNDGTSIARNCILASGGLVNRDLKIENSIYKGVPARLVEGKNALSIMF